MQCVPTSHPKALTPQAVRRMFTAGAIRAYTEFVGLI